MSIFSAAHRFVTRSTAVVPDETSCNAARAFDPLLEAHAPASVLVDNGPDSSPLHVASASDDGIAETLGVRVFLL